MSQGGKCQIVRKVKKTPKLIALKIRTQAKSETGNFFSVQTVRNILYEVVQYIMAAQPEENNTQARLTERSQFAMVKNMKGNLCFLSQMGEKKCGGERTVN